MQTERNAPVKSLARQIDDAIENDIDQWIEDKSGKTMQEELDFDNG